MDIGFEQLLAQHNQEYQDAVVFDNWMPPDGKYIASIVKLSSGSTVKDGKSTLWWRLTGRIEDVADAKLHGEEFSIGYFTSKAYGILKKAAKVLAGREINDLAEANSILEASIGSVIQVKVETRPGKGVNQGKEFTNCYIQEVVETTEATSAEEVIEAVNPALAEAPPLEAAPETEEVVG